jgi:uncharacterized repeat protein (TIGR01451 family)
MNRNVKNGLRRIAWLAGLGMAVLAAALAWAGTSQAAVPVELQGYSVQSLAGSTKTASASVVVPGDQLTYTIALRNDAASSVTAWMTDPLPSGVTYVPGTASVTPAGGTLSDTNGITWNGPISANGTVTVTFQVQADGGLEDGVAITNTATISSEGESLQRSAVVTVDALSPSIIILNPLAGEVLTSTNLLVSGMAWDGVDRPPFPSDPVLNPINNNGSGYYIVGWSDSVLATSYLLQEDSGDGFLSPTSVYAGPSTSFFVEARTPGTYYYRVQAIGAGGNSRWSNIVSATVSSLAVSIKPDGLNLPSAPAQPASDLDGVWVMLDGSPPGGLLANGALDWSLPISLPLQDLSPHTVSAYTRDAAGRTSVTDTVSFYVDRLAPAATISNLTPGQRVSGQYTIQGTTGSDASGVSRVEISLNGGATWLNATGTTLWSYLWAPTGELQTYTVTARSVDGVGNVGAPASAITVTAGETRLYLPIIFRRWPPVPYTPVLNAIDNPGPTGSYTVSWSYTGATPVTTFTLQEATDSDFLSNVTDYYPGGGAFQVVSGKVAGTYYYRVRGHNTYGPGEWSNVVSTVVRTSYFDDFGNPQSGWLITSTPTCTVGYHTKGEYQMYVPLDFRGGGTVDTWFVKPVVLAPVQPPSGKSYCVSVDTYFASQPGWWEVHGVVFGASEDLSHVYRLETNVNGDWAVMKYTTYVWPNGGLNSGEEWLISWHNGHMWPVNPDRGLNHLKVLVQGTSATFYINGERMGRLTNLNDLPAMNRVGLVGGSYEVTPVDARFDNFTWSTNLDECP